MNKWIQNSTYYDVSHCMSDHLYIIQLRYCIDAVYLVMISPIPVADEAGRRPTYWLSSLMTSPRTLEQL